MLFEYPTEYPSVKKHLFHTLLREASSLRILPKLPSINNKKDPVSGVFLSIPNPFVNSPSISPKTTLFKPFPTDLPSQLYPK